MIKFSCDSFRLSSIFVSILKRNMSLIEEYLWQTSKRLDSPSNLLPLQRGHILSSRGILSYLPVLTRRLWQPILSFTRIFLRDFFALNQCKQNGFNSFWWSDKSLVYLSAEAYGSNKRHFFFMRSTSCLILLSLSQL